MSSYEKILKNMQSAMSINEMIKDKDGKLVDYLIKDINSAYENLFNISYKDIVGKSGTTIFGDETNSIAIIKNILISKKSQYFENNFTRLGKILGVEIIPLSEIQFALIITDMTEKKKFEGERDKLRNKMEYILKGSKLGVWDWDTKNNDVEINQEIAHMLGKKLEELDNPFAFWENNLHPEDKQLVFDKIQELVDGKKKSFESIYRIKHISGKYIWVFSFGQVIEQDNDGNPGRIIGTQQDISETIEVQENYGKMIENAPIGIGIFNAQEFLYMNDEGIKIFDAEKLEDIKGINIFATAAENSKVDVSVAVKKIFEMNIFTDLVETEMISLKGNKKIIQIRAGPFKYQGKPAGISVFQDITNIKIAQERIEVNEQKYRNLVENSPIGVVVHTKDEVLYVNPSCIRIMGGESSNDFVNKNPALFVHEDFQEDMIKRLQNLWENGENIEFYEEKIKRLDGSSLWIRLNASLVNYQNQKAIQVTFQDITELKKAQKQVKSTNELLSNIFYASPSPILVMDKNAVFIECNPSFNKLVEVESKKELFGKSIFDFFINFDLDTAKENFISIKKAGLSKNNRYWIQTLKGNTRYIEVSSSVLKDKYGTSIGLMSIISDITERDKMQKAILQSQKLESLGVMAGGIAHDFNNYMMAILGNADLALMDSELNSQTKSYISDIKKSAIDASAVSNQMLAYSGKGNFIRKPLDITTIVNDLLSLVKISISNKATLNLQLQDDLPLIDGDESQIKQVIMNLLINASEALENKPGVIKISTGVQRLSSDDLIQSYIQDNLNEGEYVFIQVEDNGIGMDEVTLRRIFDPFFTTKFTGRGLGLAAVLGIIKSHNGNIIVKSKKGEGSIFKLILPKIDTKIKQSKEGKIMINTEWSENKTILLVDDEPQIVKVGALMLKKLGFNVYTALNGKEALVQYSKHQDQVDCVILDLTMPIMDGEETFMKLSQINSDVKVMFSSGYTEQELSENLRTKNYIGFIQKPYTFDNLRKKLELLLKEIHV
jgi:two-component system cell cycle sensor histidine kinase/response regulator CckA